MVFCIEIYAKIRFIFVCYNSLGELYHALVLYGLPAHHRWMACGYAARMRERRMRNLFAAMRNAFFRIRERIVGVGDVREIKWNRRT